MSYAFGLSTWILYSTGGRFLAMWSSTVCDCTMSFRSSFSFLSRRISESFLFCLRVASSAPKNLFQRASADRLTPSFCAISYPESPWASRSNDCSKNFAICCLLYLFLVISLCEIPQAEIESNTKSNNVLTKCSPLICGAPEITSNREICYPNLEPLA